ncbi:hypothetical protein RHSIM_Rhsim03G0222100 [Rhododendron simsii]|uniref:Nucleoside phosphorylase domain-containing protein n=1 Tax=Rhododendron simsii TaxID=118357 RepID=A0A834LP29_RHOSS|nr:hypothetical protein RHSIM_Rhsim03G0222100 [Rhododendron simsii]
MAAAMRGVMEVMLGVILVGFVDHVRLSVQLKSSHPLHGVVDSINGEGGPYIGLVMAYPTEEAVLVDSGLFVPSSDLPWVGLSGRRFNIGRIRGVDVIYVMSGEQTLNAGITVQILIDVFDIKGIVHYGTAGSANDSLSIGDVSVPKYVAFTGSWNWKEFHSEEEGLPELKFGAYNLPAMGDNLLAKIEFAPEQVYYSNGKPMEEVFWLPVEPKWFNLSSQLVDLELQQCINGTNCLPETPKVVYGLRASTADIFLDNAAYRKYLFGKFNVSTVDEESSAVLMTSITNGVPCVVFRGVSDLAGAATGQKSTSGLLSSSSLSSLAAVNALIVAAEFIGLSGTASLKQEQ